MPNHLHLIAPASSRRRARCRLGCVLSGFTRHLRRRRLFDETPLPTVIPDKKHLLRQVRYVHLNPCRSGLCDDPVAWPWSTHRDVIGLTDAPWVPAQLLAKVCGRRASDFARWFYDYVAGDPSVGDSMPLAKAFGSIRVPSEPLASIVDASRHATPWSATSTRRHLAILLARHRGWRSAELLGRATGLSARSVRRWAVVSDPTLLGHGARCLADPRVGAR